MQSLNFNTPSLIRELHYFDYNDLVNAGSGYVFVFNAEQSQFVALARDGYTCLPIASYFYNGCDSPIFAGLQLQIIDPITGAQISNFGNTTSDILPSQYLYTQHLPLGANDIQVITFTGNLGLYFPGFNGFPAPSTYGMFWWFIFTYVPKFPPA